MLPNGCGPILPHSFPVPSLLRVAATASDRHLKDLVHLSSSIKTRLLVPVLHADLWLHFQADAKVSAQKVVTCMVCSTNSLHVNVPAGLRTSNLALVSLLLCPLSLRSGSLCDPYTQSLQNERCLQELVPWIGPLSSQPGTNPGSPSPLCPFLSHFTHSCPRFLGGFNKFIPTLGGS